jgi:putative tricarboxylic transport membrane protein
VEVRRIMALEKIKKMLPYGIIILISAYFYFLAGNFRFSVKPGHLGPDFWPKMLLGLTMATCLYEIVKTAFFTKIVKDEETSAAAPSEKKAATKKTYPELLVIGIVMTVAYVYFVSALGFVLSTFLYFALFMIVGRYRKTWAIAVNSLVGTLVLVFIFMKVVYVSLPLGKEPFQSITLFVLGLMGIK